MRLWTFQPVEIYDKIMETGEYHCEPYLGYDTTMEFMEFEDAYLWLAQKMREKIGNPPDGIKFPVWAWHTQDWKHKKSDLRSERWCYGHYPEKYACIEIEVPDNEVVLSDYDLWHCILNKSAICFNEEEFDNFSDTKEFLEETWNRVFDVEPFEDDWFWKGRYIQATFWQLKKEMIKAVRFFKAARRKEK